MEICKIKFYKYGQVMEIYIVNVRFLRFALL